MVRLYSRLPSSHHLWLGAMIPTEVCRHDIRLCHLFICLGVVLNHGETKASNSHHQDRYDAWRKCLNHYRRDWMEERKQWWQSLVFFSVFFGFPHYHVCPVFLFILNIKRSKFRLSPWAVTLQSRCFLCLPSTRMWWTSLTQDWGTWSTWARTMRSPWPVSISAAWIHAHGNLDVWSRWVICPLQCQRAPAGLICWLVSNRRQDAAVCDIH